MEAEKKKVLRWLALFNQTPRQEVEKMIVRKAGQDPVFSEQLLTDPQKTLTCPFPADALKKPGANDGDAIGFALTSNESALSPFVFTADTT